MRYQQDLGPDIATRRTNGEQDLSLRTLSQHDDIIMKLAQGSPAKSTRNAS